MKTFRTMLLAAGAVALLGSAALRAQTKATVAIPFEFSVLNATLPAGEYTMQRLAQSPGSEFLLIRNVETNKAVAVLAPTNVSELKDGRDKHVVLFHKYGDRYFLAEVKTDAVRGHVGASKLERELEAEGSGQPMAAVIIPALGAR